MHKHVLTMVALVKVIEVIIVLLYSVLYIVFGQFNLPIHFILLLDRDVFAVCIR